MRVIRTGKTDGVPDVVLPLVDIARFLSFLLRGEHRKADIFHVHSSAYWSFLRIVPYAFVVRHFSDSKLIIHVHSGEFKQFYHGTSGIIRSLVRSTLGSADYLIVTSPAWVKVMNEIDSKLSPISSLPNGFDPARFHPSDRVEAKRSLGLPADKKLILTIGYLERVKGHRYLLEAMAEVLRRRNDVVLAIIGDGTLREQLAAMAKDLKIEENVLFIKGGKTPEEIAHWMNSADLFVLSSLNEGNPTVMFESMGCGRPMVGTRVGGVPDVITSERVGLLCEPADPVGMAKGIISAFDRSWDAEYISRYAQQFTWENIASDLLDIYRQTMGQDDGRSQGSITEK